MAGTGTNQFQAESGSSVGVNLDPVGVSVAPDGSIYIADFANDRIRRMTAAKPALLSISFGDGQSAPSGSSVPLTVKVTEAGGTPVANVTVNFSDCRLRQRDSQRRSTALTDPTGVASVQTTFGTVPGPVKISAISAGLTGVTFNLTALPPSAPTPTIGMGGLTGAGLSVPSVNALSSNGIASIFGSNLRRVPARRFSQRWAQPIW